MSYFVTSQVQAVIEGIRLLEAIVTSPLGLYSDIKMLRESLPFAEAAELPREELQERRTAYGSMTESPLAMALGVIASLKGALDAFDQIGDADGVSEMREVGWPSRARRVLARAEERVAGELRGGLVSRVRGLYVIVDPETTAGRDVEEVAAATLKGGTAVVQLRDKTRDKGEVLPVARRIREMCESAGAIFLVNDDADVAHAAGAHGLHVGQTDLPVAEARAVLGPRAIVGRSNHSMQEAMDSQSQGVDYMAMGTIYPTSTMGKGQRGPVGTDILRRLKESVSQPVVAIGGINLGNIAEVVRAGADCVCVVSAVTMADDPEAATGELVEAMGAA